MNASVDELLERLAPERIASAHERIAQHIRRTPVFDLDGTTLKLEELQYAGSFKTRGAFANMLMRPVPEAGVVAASGGNHGAAVAYAAMKRGVRCKIFVPTISSSAKVARIREFGADLEIGGAHYAEAFEASCRYARETGAMQIHAFDAIETLLGTGTLAKEFEEQAPFDTVVVGVGGGGLLGGIAAWFRNRVRVIGVEPEGAPTLTHALAAGEPVDSPVGSIAADSLAPRRIGNVVFPVVRRFVERVVLVTDEQIYRAQCDLWSTARIVAEPGGAAAFAALHAGAYVPGPGERVAVVVSGGNTVAVRFEPPEER